MPKKKKVKAKSIPGAMIDELKQTAVGFGHTTVSFTKGVFERIGNTVVKTVKTVVKSKDTLQRMSDDSIDSYDRVDNAFDGEKQATLGDILKGQETYSTLTSWGHLHQSTIEKIKNAVAYLKDWKTVQGEQKFAGIENLKFLKTENLQMLEAKQINSVLNFLSEIYSVTKRYDALRPDPSKPNKSSIEAPNRLDQKNAFMESFAIYRDILGKVDTQISKIDEVRNFGIDAYAESLHKIGKDINATEQMDAEVVRALEFTGISLKRDDTGKWVVDVEATKANEHGIELKNDRGESVYFKLDYEKPTDPIQSFLDNYLNKKPNERNGLVITGQGIFELYKRAASPKMGIIDKIKNIRDMGDIKDRTEMIAETYSLDSSEWKLFNMTRRDKVVDDSTKLALASVYMNLCAVSSDDILDQDMSDALRLNRNTKGSLVWSRINKLCDTATYFRNLANEQISSDSSKDTFINILSVNDSYETEIEKFEEIIQDRALTPAEEKIYSELKKCQKTLHLFENFQYQAINKNFGSVLKDKNRNNDALKQDILNFVKLFENCEFLNVVRQGADYKLEMDVTKLPAGLQPYAQQFAEIVNDINTPVQSTTEEQSTPKGTSTKTSGEPQFDPSVFDFKLPYLQDFEAYNLLMRSNVVDVVTPVERAEILERCKYLLNNGQENELTTMRDMLRAKFPGKKMSEIFDICRASAQDPVQAQQLADAGIDIALFNSMFDGSMPNWCMTPEIFAMVCDNDLDAMREVERQKKLVLDSVVETNSRLNDRLKLTPNPNDVSNDIKQTLAEGIYRDVREGLSKNPPEIKLTANKDQRSSALGDEYNFNSRRKVLNDIKNENTKVAEQYRGSKVAQDVLDEEQRREQEQENPSDTQKYEERITTFGDKNKKFDMEALNKKLKPYSKDWLTKWLDNLIKMIDKIKIVERVPIDGDGVIPPKKPEDETKTKDDEGVIDVEEGPIHHADLTIDPIFPFTPENPEPEPEPKPENPEPEKTEPENPENGDDNTGDDKGEKDDDQPHDDKGEETPEDKKTDPEIDLDKMSKLDMNSRRISALKVLSAALKSITDQNSPNISCISDDTKQKLKSLSKVFDTLIVEPNSSTVADYQQTLITLLCAKAVSGDSTKINERIEEVMSIPQLLGNEIQYDDDGNMKLDENGKVMSEFSNIIKNVTEIEGKNISEINKYNLANILTTVTNYSPNADGSIKFDLGDKLNDEMVDKIANCKTEQELLHMINTDPQFDEIRIALSRLSITTQKDIVATMDPTTVTFSKSPEIVTTYTTENTFDEPTM